MRVKLKGMLVLTLSLWRWDGLYSASRSTARITPVRYRSLKEYREQSPASCIP